MLILGILAASSIILTFFFFYLDSQWYDFPWFIFGIISAIAALVLTCMAIIIPIARHVGHSTCSNWSSQTSVPTKFVLLNWADTGTCLAKTPDGHWVKNSNWYAYVGVNK